VRDFEGVARDFEGMLRICEGKIYPQPIFDQFS